MRPNSLINSFCLESVSPICFKNGLEFDENVKALKSFKTTFKFSETENRHNFFDAIIEPPHTTGTKATRNNNTKNLFYSGLGRLQTNFCR